MVIRNVRPDSPAQDLGIHAGENLVSINGRKIRDLLDYHFYVADGDLEVIVEAKPGDARSFEVSLDPGQDLGIELEEMKTRLCGNDCVFYFIDQLPNGMRKTLYVKDEDYRLSFLHGNFVTLTNMKQWELERMVEQRLSPLYISVHSTNPETRRKLIRPKVDKDILHLMDYLGDNGIVMHSQIVLCPGYNDGEDLDQTIRDLSTRWPKVQSLAVVPLGMTDHRDGLVALPPVTREVAERTRVQVEGFQRAFRKEHGVDFVYLADELYRMLGVEPPPANRYDGFPQLENGIGMTRHFLSRLKRSRRLFGEATKRGERRFTLVTGELFEPILRKAVGETLARSGEPVEVEVVGCPNEFFGRSVTVAGLLTGGDIARTLEGRDLGDRVYVPPATLNDDGVFLDDTTLDGLAARFGVAFQSGFFRT
jgi:putative radical SAM enzyme (TIGR03279 family)